MLRLDYDGSRQQNGGDSMDSHKTDYASLKNDLMFHMVFTRNKKALKSILSALLGVPNESILNVDVLNPLQYSDSIDTKETILDIKVQLDKRTFIMVEMQVRKFEHWTDRTLVYACRAVADQVHKSFDYGKLEKVIQISIMDYTLFPDHKKFFAKYLLSDDENYIFTDKLQFLVMDLRQIGAATEAQKEQGLVEWANAFNAKSWDEVEKIQNSGVKEAVNTMQVIMANPKERDMIRRREDALNDWVTQINAAKREGREEGKEEGENLMASLMALLLEKGLVGEAQRASSDSLFRKELYKKYSLI
jgi:predicted transposase/invertase (TIGR01784 family)